MYETITNQTNLLEGAKLKRTYPNGRIEYYTVKGFISSKLGYELAVEGLDTGEHNDLMPIAATKAGMIAQGWEIEV